MAEQTRFFRPGMKSPEFVTEEQLGREETLGRIKELLGGKLSIVGIQKTISVTKNLAAAADYAAEDVLSESATVGTAWKFPNVVSLEGSGYIVGAQTLCSTTALTPRLTLYVFRTAPASVLNDNVANTAVLEVDLSKYIGKVDFPALEDLGGMSEALASVSTYGNLPLAFTCGAGSGDLFGILVTRDAITGEAAGMRMALRLTIEEY